MKKLIAIAMLALSLTACEQLDYGQCLHGHEYDSSYINYIYNADGTVQSFYLVPSTSFTCDAWEYPDGHGPKWVPDDSNETYVPTP